jgi:glycosyltransferase involved in cell wall biosynthesis
MRSIILTEVNEMGGAERSVLALSSWLQQRNLPHQFVAYTFADEVSSHTDHPISVVRLNPTLRVTSKVSALRKYFAANPSPYKPLVSGYQPALHATLAGLRGFHTLMHDTPTLFSPTLPTLKNRILRIVSDRITARGLRSGGRTIVTSQFLQRDTLRLFNVHADIARMGGLSHPEAFHLRPVTGTLRLFSVSRLENNKRIDWILRSLAALEQAPTPLSTKVDWRLDVTGKGSQMQQLQQMAASLGIAERVHFHGFVSDETLQTLYRESHLFLMPAVQGYGIPAIEALERGIPVLLHRESGVSDILLDTPWATVIHGNQDSMLPAIDHAIAGVLAGAHLSRPLPDLPTEDAWSERVATLCGWL